MEWEENAQLGSRLSHNSMDAVHGGLRALTTSSEPADGFCRTVIQTALRHNQYWQLFYRSMGKSRLQAAQPPVGTCGRSYVAYATSYATGYATELCSRVLQSNNLVRQGLATA